MWLAPIGAFGAIAAVVGQTGVQAIISLATLMLAFYITCIVFIVVVLGTLLKFVTGVNIFRLMRYLAREYLLIFSTSSSEVALPRLIAKMEHLGVAKPVVGITVPTGYSLNLDGTAIYLTMAALFVAEALGTPLSIGEQISLLVFMIIASKGAAGVTGAGLATLAGGLQSHRPDLVEGVGLIVGIDRFMSEARALTNFTGNAVATVLIGTWTREIDKDQVEQVLSGAFPFDEVTMDEDHGYEGPPEGALEHEEHEREAAGAAAPRQEER
jgi:aerobic C4-dicarboxylate transport protein